MPELPNRDGFESELSKALLAEFRRFANMLGRVIPGLPSAAADIPFDEWAKHNDKLNGIIAPLLSNVFVEQSSAIIDELGFTSIDWGLVDTQASEWARDYTFKLVSELDMTDRRRLQRLIPDYFEQQWTQGRLKEQLVPTFGDVRAQMIARTEVTRAASEGTQTTRRELSRQGIDMVERWQTRNDEIVCPICGPRNGEEISADNEHTQGQYPPAHPRCRCWVTLELP